MGSSRRAVEDDERTPVNLLGEQIEFAGVVVMTEISDAIPEQDDDARALVTGLRLLIADEPTAMHDAISRVRIWTAPLDLARQRCFAVLAISHDDALLAAIGARIVSLAGGRLVDPSRPS